MNAERLLALYDRVAEAPVAIPRLRRFVLDLAVQGRLVEQDPTDEPASELLKRISAEKVRLLKAGEIKPERTGKNRVSSPARFILPMRWEWATLQAVCMSITDGDHLPPPRADRGVPFLVISNVRTQTINYRSERWVPRSYYEALDSSRQPHPGDLLYTLVGSFGIPVEVLETKEFCVQRHIGIIRPAQWISSRFLARMMASRFIFDQADACATGIAQKTVPLSGLRSLLIPLPPLAEQHRIVAKVDECMALCDHLEEARSTCEEGRRRLTKSSYARLSSPDTDDTMFRSHARFAVDAFPALTAHADQVKHLRQTILNLAVRGKLVEQDPADEPATELLIRIAAEKARLVKAGEITKQRVLPPVEEPPFDVPENWRWIRMREVTSNRGQRVPDTAFTYIDVTAIDKRNGLVVGPKVLEPGEAPSRARKVVQLGDVIYSCVRPYLLNVAVIEDDFDPNPIVSTAFAVLNGHGFVVPRYLWIVLRSSFMVACVEQNQRGQAYPAINDADFAILPFPLPPLAEQRRIVTKVDELVALCDRLEANLEIADNGRQGLFESLLRDVLEPRNEPGEAQRQELSTAPRSKCSPTSLSGSQRKNQSKPSPS